MCLRSARTALEVNSLLEKEKTNLSCAPARFGTAVHHVFMATVVLVMDLCFNKIEGQEEQRQAEVMRACKMLQESKQDSVLSKMFLDPLMEILQKHRLLVLNGQESLPFTPSTARQLPTLPDRHQPADSTSQQALQQPVATDINQFSNNTGSTAFDNSNGPQYDMMQAYDDTGIDEMMQNYIELGPNMGVPRWDDLFADLDSYQAMDVGGNDFYCE